MNRSMKDVCMLGGSGLQSKVPVPVKPVNFYGTRADGVSISMILWTSFKNGHKHHTCKPERTPPPPFYVLGTSKH